jgi:hypothetical protein
MDCNSATPIESLSYRELQAQARALGGIKLNSKRAVLERDIIAARNARHGTMGQTTRYEVVNMSPTVSILNSAPVDTTARESVWDEHVVLVEPATLSPTVMVAAQEADGFANDEDGFDEAENNFDVAKSPRGLSLTPRGTLDWNALRTTTKFLSPPLSTIRIEELEIEQQNQQQQYQQQLAQRFTPKRVLLAGDGPTVRLNGATVARMDALVKKQRFGQ